MTVGSQRGTEDTVGTCTVGGGVHETPEKGDYHVHELTVEENELRFVLNGPDSLSLERYHDQTNHELRFPTYSRLHEMIEAGDVKAR